MNNGFFLKKKVIYAGNAVRGVIISSLFLIYGGKSSILTPTFSSVTPISFNIGPD